MLITKRTCDFCGEEVSEYYMAVSREGWYTMYGLQSNYDICLTCWGKIQKFAERELGDDTNTIQNSETHCDVSD